MKNLLISIFLLFPLCSFAQTSGKSPWLEKGEIQVGVGFGPNFGKYGGTTTRTTPYLQYFIKDCWSIRLEGQYEAYRMTGSFGDRSRRPRTLGVGLSTQYYFLKKNRLALYAQAGYSLGRYRVDVPEFFEPGTLSVRTIRTNFNRFNLGVGAQYRISDRWMINAQINRLETSRFIGGDYQRQCGNCIPDQVDELFSPPTL